MELGHFLTQLASSPLLLMTVALTLSVILVNGWTDAPNAIATCVSTRAIHPKTAIALAAIFNFLGVLVMTLVNNKVAMTIFNMVDFKGDTQQAISALCAAMVAIVLWATAAWAFGIPTSESHALIAGLSGAAIALQGGFSGINGEEWKKVLYGLVISTGLGFSSGYLMAKLTEAVFKNIDRRRSNNFFRGAQVFGSCSMAFMHGAQDGQKFMGIFMLNFFLIEGQAVSAASVPLWLMLMCSLIMGLGTSMGGLKIIKSVGLDMVKLKPYQGFSSDVAGAACLLLSSLAGIPVSTTHTKTTAIMGVGASVRLSAVNWRVVKDMVLAWILTFPGCGLLGYLMVKLFINIF